MSVVMLVVDLQGYGMVSGREQSGHYPLPCDDV
jgi:hypothetical protein